MAVEPVHLGRGSWVVSSNSEFFGIYLKPEALSSSRHWSEG